MGELERKDTLMFYSVTCFDKPGVVDKRNEVHPAHVQYVKDQGKTVHAGGPFQEDDGTPIGALFILDVPDRETAQRWIDLEPFHKAGLYETVLIRQWVQIVPLSP